MHTKTVLSLFLLVSFAATAQQFLHAAQFPDKAKRNAGPITIRGCVNGGKQGYTVTQQSTDTTFELQGDPSRFEQFRGKTVELTGSEAPPSQITRRNDLPKLTVKEIHVVEGQCPFTEGGGNASRPTGTPITVPGTQSPPPQKEQPTAATPRYQPPGAPNQTPPSVGNNPNMQGANGAPSAGSGNPPPKEPSSSAPPPQL